MSGNGAKHTRKRLPVKLVYVEYYEHVYLAFRREKQIQNWSHKKKTALINMDCEKLHLLAELYTERSRGGGLCNSTKYLKVGIL